MLITHHRYLILYHTYSKMCCFLIAQIQRNTLPLVPGCPKEEKEKQHKIVIFCCRMAFLWHLISGAKSHRLFMFVVHFSSLLHISFPIFWSFQSHVIPQRSSFPSLCTSVPTGMLLSCPSPSTYFSTLKMKSCLPSIKKFS